MKSHIFEEVPIVIILKALGLTSDGDILNAVL